jgi:hypothetical protein
LIGESSSTSISEILDTNDGASPLKHIDYF